MGKEDDNISQINQKWQLKTIFVHVLVMIFGISAWIGVNGIFIQLPLLVNTLPERWGLAAYLVIAVQAANIAPIIYSLLHKSSFKINESKCITGMLGIGCFTMGLLAFFHNEKSVIADREHSTALFILTFLMSVVSCTSSVLFMPYLRNFKEIYLVSYFVGEGLSGVVPSIVALIQGISENSLCNNNTRISDKEDTTLPRFSSQYYFLFIFANLFFSLIAFFLLENLPYIKEEKISPRSSKNNSFDNDIQQSCYCQKYKLTSPEGLTTESDHLEKHICMDNYKKTDTEKNSKYCHIKNNGHLTLDKLYLYILLSIICLLANGLLPGLQPYSCLSYGNMVYHLSATFSQIANPCACFLALWFLPRSKKTINYLSIVIFTTSSYIIYLALSSPNPPFQGTRFGKILVILSWTLLVALISYIKLIITSVFRRKSEKTLFCVGVVMQAGSACGAVLSFILINFTNLLQEYNECSE